MANKISISLFIACIYGAINVYSQPESESHLPACCFPNYYWEFDEMYTLCSHDYNNGCGGKEISSSVCNSGCGGVVVPFPNCCNYFSTHGTPSLGKVGSKIFLELWGDRYSGGEGMMFCILSYYPACYSLTFEVKLGSPSGNLGNLSVNIVNLGEIGESISNWACYQQEPYVDPNYIIEIASIELSDLENPTNWYTVTVNFATTEKIIQSTANSSRGFMLWFYSDFQNLNQRSIQIDNVSLSHLHSQICVENLILTENDAPITGQYDAHNSINTLGNLLLTINEAWLYAGNYVRLNGNTLIMPTSNSQATYLDIVANCLECLNQVSIDFGIPDDPPPPFKDPENSDIAYISNMHFAEDLCQQNYEVANSIKLLISDAVLGSLSTYMLNSNDKIDDQIHAILESLPESKLYLVSLVCNNLMVATKKYFKL